MDRSFEADPAAALPSDDDAPFVLSTIHAAEEWLSSSHFARSLRKNYERLCHGQGKNDRHIDLHIWLDTVVGVHADLLLVNSGHDECHPLNLLHLQQFLPEPDEEFIKTCCEILRQNTTSTTSAGTAEQAFPSWQELVKDGIDDYEQFEEMAQAVFVQMAHCAELLTAQLAGVMGGGGGGGSSGKTGGGTTGSGTGSGSVEGRTSASLGARLGTLGVPAGFLRDPAVNGVQTRNT
eukprot:g411.t1